MGITGSKGEGGYEFMCIYVHVLAIMPVDKGNVSSMRCFFRQMPVPCPNLLALHASDYLLHTFLSKWPHLRKRTETRLGALVKDEAVALLAHNNVPRVEGPRRHHDGRQNVVRDEHVGNTLVHKLCGSGRRK